MKDITVNEWIKKFNNGDFDNDYYAANWYDWFCKDTSLNNKTKRYGRIIKQLKSENILNNHYVFFKNNCPMNGGLYDDFRFCDLESGDVIYNINVDCPHFDFKYCLYEKENGFSEPSQKFNTTKELINYLNTK
jgi:hypothetical protein